MLALELALAVLPVTIHYLRLFPVGLFWTGRVVQLATGGILNPFTVSMAGVFLLGGLGLAALWITIGGRLLGRETSGRLGRSGLLLGGLASLWLLYVLTIIGAEPLDYYLYGAPLVAAAHMLFLGRRR